ncbi:MAG: hypothetical protein LC624_06250 [Halobacteriales archaeon]|nr:hypothetical protein [Halobacteriales archaeon]
MVVRIRLLLPALLGLLVGLALLPRVPLAGALVAVFGGCGVLAGLGTGWKADLPKVDAPHHGPDDGCF